MVNTKSLIGKVVTIRFTSGEEILAVLIKSDEKTGVYTVTQPRIVVISNNEVSLLPYVLTADVQTVEINADVVTSMLVTYKNTAKEYTTLVESEISTQEDLSTPIEAELLD